MFQKNSSSEKVFEYEGEGVSGFYVENILSQRTEKIRRGTLLFFKMFQVSEIFVSNREISPFSRKKLFLKVLKNFVGEPFCVSQNFLYPKELWMKGKGTEALS